MQLNQKKKKHTEPSHGFLAARHQLDSLTLSLIKSSTLPEPFLPLMLMPLRATLNISSTDVNIALTAVSPVLGPYATKWGCCCCPRRHEIHTPSSRSQNPSPRQTEFRPRLCATSACVVLFFEVSSNITHTQTHTAVYCGGRPLLLCL